MTNMTPDPVLHFWNQRAALKERAGSNDVYAKKLEVDTLLSYATDGMEIAEFGCGNGITAMRFAQLFDVSVAAFDYSAEMISEAKKLLAKTPLRGRVDFAVADVRTDFSCDSRFDLIVTERMLINLKDWEEQAAAICRLAALLKCNGRLVLCENSQNGLAEINRLREMIGLSCITPPWHNRYLEDSEMTALEVPGCALIDTVPFSATYYFLSRVVNAWLAKESGIEPSYDAPINRLGALLPASGACAQGKIWVWQRGE